MLEDEMEKHPQISIYCATNPTYENKGLTHMFIGGFGGGLLEVVVMDYVQQQKQLEVTVMVLICWELIRRKVYKEHIS